MKLTKKAFKEYLNEKFKDPTYRNGKFKQLKRPYGDYLYSQDREQFDMEYEIWKDLNATLHPL